ncbi:MAG: hypothetical protein LBP76_14495 [Treponema sp.]|jgi:hypothetical protein|nr:hypothetical protein [Treponema sp.]
MKIALVLCPLLFLAGTLTGATNDYRGPASYETAYFYRTDTPDQNIKQFPQSIDALRAKDAALYVRQTADYINRSSKNNFERIKKAHDVVALTIRYDAASFLSGRVPSQKYEDILRGGLAVCEGYSNVFKRLCDELKIECEIVHGFGRGVGTSPFRNDTPASSNHAWNLVKIEGAWYLVDCTWDSGHLNGRAFQAEYSTDYLFLKPEYFIYTHFPDTPRQQLISSPLSADAFSKLPFFKPKFFDSLSGLNPALQKINAANGTLGFTFTLNAGFEVSFSVYDEAGGKKYDNCSFTQKEGASYKTYLSFPSPGNYTVKCFWKKPGQNVSSSCGEFGVRSGRASAVKYPLQYGNFGPEITIVSPLEMPLAAGRKYNFTLRCDTNYAAVIYDKTFVQLQKNNEGVFSVEAAIPPGVKTVMIGTSNTLNGRYTGVIQYEVK